MGGGIVSGYCGRCFVAGYNGADFSKINSDSNVSKVREINYNPESESVIVSFLDEYPNLFERLSGARDNELLYFHKLGGQVSLLKDQKKIEISNSVEDSELFGNLDIISNNKITRRLK